MQNSLFLRNWGADTETALGAEAQTESDESKHYKALITSKGAINIQIHGAVER